jgi:hypothetical protein
MAPAGVPMQVLAIESTWVVVLTVVVLGLFALAIVFAAIWYHFRQPKEVRMDGDDEEESYVFRDDEARR